MKWEFSKTVIVGYGVLFDPKGNKYNVEYDNDFNISATTTKKNAIVNIPIKVQKLIICKLKEGNKNG